MVRTLREDNTISNILTEFPKIIQEQGRYKESPTAKGEGKATNRNQKPKFKHQ